MTSAAPLPTFRDPAGSLRLERDGVVRTIHDAARTEVLEFLGSAFCERIQGRGDLIEAQVEDTPEGLRLLHPRIAAPAYPWEWTGGQWMAAAELTLRLGEEALEEGWILKDATPHNVLFAGARPVLVDILSFERRDPASSVWLAYGQYVRTFLLPLAMNRMLGWPLTLSFFRRDGLEPAELYRSLGWRQRMSRAAFWPITLPAWLERRKGADAGQSRRANTSDPELALHVLRRTMRGLRTRTRAAAAKSKNSEWGEYSGNLTHYTAEQVEEKSAWLRRALERTRPARVLDVGANTGDYSALAAEAGAEVVALERDAATAEKLFERSVAAAAKGEFIQTIVADLARPTPAAGWENGESLALLTRLRGEFDLVLMLAVIHHLLLLEQIPLGSIVELLHGLTRRWAVVEWVPAEDPMYRSLMRGRDRLYGSIAEGDLLAECRGRFTAVERFALGNGRVLFLLEKMEKDERSVAPSARRRA